MALPSSSIENLPTPSPFKAACIQMRSRLSRQENIDDACQLIQKAAKAGVKLVVTPEMTNVLDRKASRLFEALPGENNLGEIETFNQLAKELNIWILIGSMALRSERLGEDGKPRAHNRGYLFDPSGKIHTHYDKIHMFDVSLPHGEVWHESAVYEPGERAVIARTPLGNLALTICYDVRFPTLYRTLARSGAQIFAIPAAFTQQTGRAHWEILLRARAIECGAFVIAPGQGGTHEDGRETWGHSMIIDPWGKILAADESDEPGIIIAEIDPSLVKTTRQRIPNLDLEPSYTVTT